MLFRCNKAYTLVEVLLASAIGLVMLGILYQLWSYSRFVSSTAHQGYVLTEDVGTAYRSLQRELLETSLTSILVEGLSVSFHSARDEKGLHIGPDGAPQWLKRVRYTLRQSAKEPSVGELVREEKDLPHGSLPFPEPMPWREVPDPSARVMALGLLYPGYALSAGPGGLLTVQPNDHGPGGFVVRFLRRSGHGEEFSELNPTTLGDVGHAPPHKEIDQSKEHEEHNNDHQDSWTKGSTGLVQVTMGVLERDSSTGQFGYVELRMRVRPAHD